jgi:hypothetical protein
VVFPQVHAGLGLALEGHAGAVHFGKAVGIEHAQAEAGFDLAPGLLGVGFGAHEGALERQILARVDASLFQNVGEIQREARREVNAGGVKILHQEELALAVAGARGNHQTADLLGAVVGDQRAGEEAVGHHVLEDVPFGHAGGHEAARDELGGVVDILAREEQGLGFARGAARRVQAQGFVEGHRQHAGGIGLAQIGARW